MCHSDHILLRYAQQPAGPIGSTVLTYLPSGQRRPTTIVRRGEGNIYLGACFPKSRISASGGADSLEGASTEKLSGIQSNARGTPDYLSNTAEGTNVEPPPPASAPS